MMHRRCFELSAHATTTHAASERASTAELSRATAGRALFRRLIERIGTYLRSTVKPAQKRTTLAYAARPLFLLTLLSYNFSCFVHFRPNPARDAFTTLLAILNFGMNFFVSFSLFISAYLDTPRTRAALFRSSKTSVAGRAQKHE